MSLNPKLRDWHGQRVWLVGAGHGIGAALAQALQQQGAHVALSGRTEAALHAVAAGQERMQVHVMDATVPDDWQRVRDTLLASWGRIDLVVMLAGDYTPLRAWELTPEAAQRMVNVNLLASLYGVAANVPQLMAQQGGGLVLVASVAGWAGMSNGLVYGATKAAVNHLAQTLYLDLHPHGIGVYVVNPGFVTTRLTAQNDFAMPALISPQQAADAILRGLARGEFDIHFPKRFTRALKLAAHLPYRLYFWLAHKVTGL